MSKSPAAPSPDNNAVPEALREQDRWLLWDKSTDRKQPIDSGGEYVSWNDPDCWLSYSQASDLAEQHRSWGLGFVVNTDDIGLYILDIDGGVTENGTKDWVPDIDRIDGYKEYSQSGDGIHIPVWGEPPEWWRDSQFPDAHEGVDALTNKFCIFTGDILETGEICYDEEAVSSWLIEAYYNIRGELPRVQDDSGEYDAELGQEEVEEALDAIDPDCTHEEWIQLAYAVHAWDSGSTGQRVFTQWSKQGRKYDKMAERQIESVWEQGAQGQGVTVGTLVYKAKEAGWSPPEPEPEAEPDDLDGWARVAATYEDKETKNTVADALAADILVDQNEFVTVRESGETYRYSNEKGYYERNSESYIRGQLRKHVRQYMTTARRNNIIEHVQSDSYVEADDFTPPEGKMLVANGVLDLESRTLEEPSPDYYFTSRLPVDYDPDAGCPTWKDFVRESVTDRDSMKKLQEFAGYCLQPWTHRRAKNMFIVGPSQTGKSTYADVLQDHLFGGHPAVSNLTPQQIADNRFDSAGLLESVVNIRNDIDSTKIEDSGTLKTVLAGERIKMERKHQDQFWAEPKTKHLFTANWLPSVYGASEAFYRRILLVEFPNQVDDEDVDLNLKSKLASEASGILNWAVDGLHRLREQGGFTADRSNMETKRLWTAWRSSVLLFFDRCVIQTGKPSDNIDAKSCYMAYSEWAHRNNINPESQRSMTNLVKYNLADVRYADGRFEGAQIIGSERDADLKHLLMKEIVEEYDSGQTINIGEMADKYDADKDAVVERLETIKTERGTIIGEVGNYMKN